MNSSAARKYNVSEPSFYHYEQEADLYEYTPPKLTVRNGAKGRKKAPTFRLICCGVLLVALIATVIYGNVVQVEMGDRVVSVTKKLNELQGEGALLETKIESMASTKAIEEYASRELGMGKVENYQVTYIYRAGEDQIEAQNTGLDIPVGETMLKAYNGLLEYLKLN